MWVLVPVKPLTQTKQRLRGVLTPTERQGLTLAMLQDVLTAAARATRPVGVLVVSRCPHVAMWARALGASVFAESVDVGLSAALTEASAYLVRHHGATGTLILPSDVPLVTAPDIDALLTRPDPVTLVPDHLGTGTNALVCSPPNAMRLHFGEGSLARHGQAARAVGVAPLIVRNARISQDLDEPDDLWRVRDMGRASFARTFLQRLALDERLHGRRVLAC
ncbi:MAG: 2-phospho-L-lactate guanylyltransferase [Pseudomonadota bacterium]